MRPASGRTWQMVAALQLLCAGLPACRPSDFDGLDRGSRARDGGDARDETPDAEPTSRDADGDDGGDDQDSEAPPAPDAQLPKLGGEDAGLVDAGVIDAASGMDAAADAQADAALADAADAQQAADAGPVTVQLAIREDHDDALWFNANGSSQERLNYSPSDGAAGYTIEVGSDSEACRAGLRFALPLGHGAQVLSAKLQLRRLGPASDADASSTMTVRVYESDSVAPFDGNHLHPTPKEHDPGGIWLGLAVTGYAVGMTDAWNESPDLAALVQHVIDRSAFRAGNYIGFVLSPEGLPGTQYAQFHDSSGQDPAVLTVRYFP